MPVELLPTQTRWGTNPDKACCLAVWSALRELDYSAEIRTERPDAGKYEVNVDLEIHFNEESLTQSDVNNLVAVVRKRLLLEGCQQPTDWLFSIYVDGERVGEGGTT